jgi:hypothetical protein
MVERKENVDVTRLLTKLECKTENAPDAQAAYLKYAETRSEFMDHFARAHGASFAGRLSTALYYEPPYVAATSADVFQLSDVPAIEPRLLECLAAPGASGLVVIDLSVFSFREWRTHHSNVLLIDRAARRVEHFEPYGVGRANHLLVPVLRRWMATVPPLNDYAFVGAEELSPVDGWQRLTDDLMCAQWCALLVALRLLHPSAATRDLVRTVLGAGAAGLPDVIQSFTRFAGAYCREHGIAQKIAQKIAAEHAKWEALCADEKKIAAVVEAAHACAGNPNGDVDGIAAELATRAVDGIAAELATRAVALRESYMRVKCDGGSDALALMEDRQREWRVALGRLVLAAPLSFPKNESA